MSIKYWKFYDESKQILKSHFVIYFHFFLTFSVWNALFIQRRQKIFAFFSIFFHVVRVFMLVSIMKSFRRKLFTSKSSSTKSARGKIISSIYYLKKSLIHVVNIHVTKRILSSTFIHILICLIRISLEIYILRSQNCKISLKTKI